MNKLIAIGVAVAMLAAVAPAVDADTREQEHSYLPLVGLTVWCSEDEHAGIPLTPTQPPIGDPVNDPDNSTDDMLGWGFSGEPECLPHDAYNAGREQQGDDRVSGGYGGAAMYILNDELGTSLLSVNTDDDAFGVGTSHIAIDIAVPGTGPDGEDNDVFVEGCGPQEAAIPSEVEEHWQSDPNGDPYYLAWTFLDPVFVDDELNYCFSSTGLIKVTISDIA